ncbi:MAG: hypothetical protein K2X11_08375 [Acetobacteraceae bacterium]|nr:hypothetical protein [Acetobacteraceae bacterium]
MKSVSSSAVERQTSISHVSGSTGTLLSNSTGVGIPAGRNDAEPNRPLIALECFRSRVAVCGSMAVPPPPGRLCVYAVNHDTRVVVGVVRVAGKPDWPIVVTKVLGIGAMPCERPRTVVTDPLPIFTDGGLTQALDELGIEHVLLRPGESWLHDQEQRLNSGLAKSLIDALKAASER